MITWCLLDAKETTVNTQTKVIKCPLTPKTERNIILHTILEVSQQNVCLSLLLFLCLKRRDPKSNTTPLLLYFQRQRYPVSVVVFVSHAIASCSMISSSLWTVVIIDVNHPLFYRQTPTEGHSNVRLEGNHKNSWPTQEITWTPRVWLFHDLKK